MIKKYIFLLLPLVFCFTKAIAQTTYYYYKGNKIPLSIDNNKVCLSVPKSIGLRSKAILKDVQVLDTIRDADFEISIIQQSDLKMLKSSDSWKKTEDYILLSSCYRTNEDKEVFLTPYLNVRLKRAQDVSMLSLHAEKYGLRIIRNSQLMPLWYTLSTTPKTGRNALDTANALWESGNFAASVPDFCSNDILCSDDPMFNLQWGLNNNTNEGIDIAICSAWNYATGKGVKIGVLDTGVDMTHIDLAPNISIFSYDSETNTSPSILYGNHGTHCAGIAAAVKDNDIYIAGVAPEATIVSISNSLSGATESRLKRAEGIIWAYLHGVDVISNSWHSATFHSAIDEAIQKAFTYGRNGKGCVITFAAGNQAIYTNGINYPANCNDTILAVGSIGISGNRAYNSQYGPGLDLVAPGVNILSTLPNDSVGFKGGTSMACPHVAGVAALILQRNPELSVTQVNSIICRNAKKLSGVNFNETKPDGTWNEQYGYGLVDAFNSLVETPEIVYIQNDTITGTRTIFAEKIYVGKDVTDRKEQGNVTLGQGDITLNAKNVIIKNSTSVPLGTKLIITH